MHELEVARWSSMPAEAHPVVDCGRGLRKCVTTCMGHAWIMLVHGLNPGNHGVDDRQLLAWPPVLEEPPPPLLLPGKLLWP